MLLIWSSCEPDKFGINFFSREFYRASTRGFELSLIDICALTLAGNLLINWKENKRILLPALTCPYLFYLLIALISWALNCQNLPVPDPVVTNKYTIYPPPYAQFELWLYPLFEISKILRGLFLFWILVNYLQNPEYIKIIYMGLLLTVIYLTLLALRDRYIFGFHRIKTNLGHANSFSTYMAMLGTLFFPLILYAKSWLSSFVYSFLVACCGLCVILTVSRGGLVAMALGIACCLFFLCRRIFSLKNIILLSIGLFFTAIILFISSDTLINRFFNKQDASEDMTYRGKYNKKAKLMAAENVFGVGIGNFSAWSWLKYARQVDEQLPPGTPPHNLWFINLGELGYPGLIAFAIIWIRLYWMAFLNLIKTRKDKYLYTVSTACLGASLVLHFQSMLQLGYRQSPQYFLMIIICSIIVAIHHIKKEPLSTTATTT
ncbi:O-antigen ligase family protein [Lentisphaera profundi]|uniref:O-antigen ligase family protein n=1 Tax=Lentisphaera profundi TaxID=1658616 RepID=A0ABY7W0N0_9BACT|nr:O-antigen ligase family protein [Lentisphaera profundi]WDE98544.1 O-antigen ligase family protein [Lentisphaera profundi]